MLGNTLQEQQNGYLTLKICKDKAGWSNNLFYRWRLTLRIQPVAENSVRLRGIALEEQTVQLLYKLKEYGIRAKLLPSLLGVNLSTYACDDCERCQRAKPVLDDQDVEVCPVCGGVIFWV